MYTNAQRLNDIFLKECWGGGGDFKFQESNKTERITYQKHEDTFQAIIKVFNSASLC